MLSYSDTDNVSQAITIDPSLKHLQIASDGVNIAIETSGGVNPDPKVIGMILTDKITVKLP